MPSQAIAAIQNKYCILGRTNELQQALNAIKEKKHTLIEGPVGVGKTVIAVALANYFGKSIYRVDGDERYTEQKMVGWFDLPQVMATVSKGKRVYVENFIELPRAVLEILR